MRIYILAPLLLTAACATTSGRYDPALDMAAAERAFARDAQSRTVNQAFLTALSYDAVLFRPGPVNGIQFLKDRPMAATLSLRWAPIYAETSSDQTIGFTTGVYEVGQRGAAPSGTGYFVTIWHHEGGDWRVALDAGVRTPIPFPVDSAARYLKTRSNQYRFRPDSVLEQIDDALNASLVARLPDFAAPDIRLYRDGSAPGTNLDEALVIARKAAVGTMTRTKMRIPRSGDLAYTYGVMKTDQGERGWLRIYRKTNMSVWKLILEIV